MIVKDPYSLINLKSKVFTNGCFDIVHAGHIDFFKIAKTYGTNLIVAVNSDESIKRIKGESRPIVCLKHRLMLLDSIKYIDYLVSFEEDTPIEIIKIIKPDVLLKGADWKDKGGIVGMDFVSSYGGEVKYLDLIEGLSTSSIIKRIKDGNL